MRAGSLCGRIATGFSILSVSLAPSFASAQNGGSRLPPANIKYETWSLLLICGTAWLGKQSDKDVEDLQTDFKAFGDAIGKHDFASWFPIDSQKPMTKRNVDLSGMNEYCTGYGVSAGDPPVIVTTSSYPDTRTRYDTIIHLDGDSTARRAMMNRLIDQVRSKHLDQKTLRDQDRQDLLFNAIVQAVAGIGCYFNKTSVSLDWKVLNIKIEHDSPSSCT